MIQVRDLAVEVGGKTLAEGISFDVRAKDKVGLVGRNGAGKTSLFKTLGGALPPKSGTVKITGGVGYLSQDPRVDDVPPDTPGLTHVLSGRGLDEAMVRLEKARLRIEENPSEDNVARFSRLQERFEMEGGYAAESEVRRIASGLGLEDDRLDLPIGVLSGGQRRRVELARILFAGSDVLLLDEPTNHLDADAKDWLLGFLRSYQGALLVISHDLDLLDEAITRVIHLDREGEEALGEVVEYKGTYSQYLVAREKDEERLAKLADRQEAEIRRLATLADSMRGQTAKRARQAKSLDTRVSKLEEKKVEGPQKRRTMQVRFPEPPHAGRTVVEVDGLAKSYGDLTVFVDVEFDLGRGERILVMGLNGAGKTSLLRILAGETQADLGTVRWGHNVSVGYYAQEHEGIDAGRSLLDHMREQAGLDDEELRRLMGMFGLSGDKAHQDAGTLSGGEKTKLALAQLVAGRHNLLLLDEPTNNLDPGSRTATANALADWPGTMIIVSHDAEFVRELQPDRVLMMPEAQLDYWSDDLLELVELS
ncbi:ABC-F family ATP-binding cassette domain-containing protein [Actinomarinicola tropica]|uniref:ATP-binding cassette domain-containing protein n=1 Tax=Actinomarinicola tropica TaxID=2789776 RepID=A0A5Q2RLY8_9ACTN|nr:ABC-F family ATP-binding cassette domain-containing protein [Actinomarinicola tropica]QGG95952.1 ATP-binding cassette domain-containing protein [Actinomarinicola tropica]